MSHTFTIRIQDDLAHWLEDTAKAMGISKGRLIREQLERVREQETTGRGFMRLAGCVQGDTKLSTRKGFSRS